MAAHTAVKHELLVRYLDAWTPTVLHTARQVRYVDGNALAAVEPGREDGSAGAALRVFTEFSDRLTGHELELVLAGGDQQGLTALAARLMAFDSVPPGLSIRSGGLEPFNGPTFLYLDAAPALPPNLRALVRHRASEVLVVLASTGNANSVGDALAALHHAGLSAVVHVELVDSSGVAQHLLFGTRSAKNLEKFKTELWAVDEYAGIRYRDPLDGEAELLDISATPPIGPLRRALLAVVRSGPCTMTDLRQHTATRTMYRTEEATRAVNALLAAGALTRDPAKGRLSAETLLSPAGGP